MGVAANFISTIYYCLIAYIAAVLLWNLIKTKSWEREVLYILVLLPFLLRLFRLK